MASQDPNINIRVSVDDANARQDLQQDTRIVDDLGNSAAHAGRHFGGMGSIIQTVAGVAVGALGAFSVAELSNEVLQVNRDFQTLRANLTSTVGEANTDLAFSFIKSLGQDAEQTTDAFIKLANLGLKPSAEALSAYGNTAAAQGKDIMQMIEAVADASTGEFERLKEFGIKASQQNDQVAFTFQGATTRIGNNAAEIQKYLIDIGNNKFGDALANQAKTIDGQLGNLKSTWREFMDNLLSAERENMLAKWVGGAVTALHALDVAINGAISQADQLAEIDRKIAQKRESLAAHNSNSAIGSLIDDLAGYDPNLVLNQIDSLVKARANLLKAQQDQEAKQKALIDGLDKTGGSGADSAALKQNDAYAKVMEKLAAKNRELTMTSRDAFAEQLKIEGLRDEQIKSALALFDANNKLTEAQKQQAEAEKQRLQTIKQLEQQQSQLAESFDAAVKQEMLALQNRNVLLTQGERAAYKENLIAKLSALSNEEQAKAYAERAMQGYDINKRLEEKQKLQEFEINQMETLIDQYKQLTLSARDYYIWSQQKPNITPEQATKENRINQFDANQAVISDNAKIDDARQGIDQYNQSLDNTYQSLASLSQINATIWGEQVSGIDSVIGAWDRLNFNVQENAKELQKLQAVKELNLELNTKDGRLSDVGFANKARYAAQEAKLLQQKTFIEIDGARQTAGAVADLFDQKSAAAEAFHAVETGLAVASLAMKAQEMAMNIPLTLSNISAGASAMFAQGGFAGFAGVGAMLAVMASLGWFGGGDVDPPPTSPTTGTVLGDATAESKSMQNLLSLLDDIHAKEYAALQSIDTGINAMNDAVRLTVTQALKTNLPGGGLGNLSNTMDTDLLGQLIDKLDPSKGLAGTAITGGLSYLVTNVVAGALFSPTIGLAIAGPIGIAAGLLFSGIMSMFSGGYTSLVQNGILAPAQTAGSITENGFDAKQYQLFKIRGWDWLSDWTDWETRTGELNKDVLAALDSTYKTAINTVDSLATGLDLALGDAIDAYQFPELKVDLKDKTGQEAVDALSAAINTQIDQFAESVLGPSLSKYQQLEEGMFETAGRLLIEVALINDALGDKAALLKGSIVEIADEIVQAFGTGSEGVKNFSSTFGTYVDNFYTDQEQQARKLSQLSNVLAGVGIDQVPDSIANYRKLVDSLDLTDAAQRQQYVTLLQVNQAAADYYKSLGDSIQIYQDLQDYLDSLRFDKELTSLTPAEQLRAARQDFSTTLTSAQAGNLGAADQLKDVLDTYLKAADVYFGGGPAYQQVLSDATNLTQTVIDQGTGKVDGVHFDGLARVPFDGYIGELHKDEAVLTAKEADIYRRGGLNVNIPRPAWLDNLSATPGSAGANVSYQDIERLLKQSVDLLKEIREEMELNNKHAAAGVVASQVGFTRTIESLNDQAEELQKQARARRIDANA